jgi:hypothetical protein
MFQVSRPSPLFFPVSSIDGFDFEVSACAAFLAAAMSSAAARALTSVSRAAFSWKPVSQRRCSVYPKTFV